MPAGELTYAANIFWSVDDHSFIPAPGSRTEALAGEIALSGTPLLALDCPDGNSNGNDNSNLLALGALPAGVRRDAWPLALQRLCQG